MIPLLDSNTAKQLDQFLISEIGLPGLILMENAARSSAEIISDELETGSSVTVLCGSGNNGGDGFSIARHLLKNFDVDILWIGSESNMSDETRHNYNLVQKLQIPIYKVSELNSSELTIDSDAIVDALIGIGFDGELKQTYKNILDIVNDSEALKIAIDMPSGLNSENGLADESCFEADLTITMFAPKIGLFLNDGIEKSGNLIIAHLSIEVKYIQKFSIGELLENTDIEAILPYKKENISKFDNGRVAIIAGSRNMPGAATLISNACISAGAGLVTLATGQISPELKPEIMLLHTDQTSNGFLADTNLLRLSKLAEDSDVIAVGPGLGKERKSLELVRSIITQYEEKKIVIDADALAVINIGSELNENFIITPHSGELSKILAVPRLDIEKDPHKYVKLASEKLNCTVVLKGSTTLISFRGFVYCDLNGNNGMATAGSGDVLTGIIAAFLAQGLKPLEAGIVGVNLHGRAGDAYVSHKNRFSLTATDLIEEVSKLDI